MNFGILSDSKPPAHRWAFFRCGGVNQVLLRNAADLAALDGLDPKLWMALAMPAAGVTVDPVTFAMLDTDQDGSLRPPEILAALRWTLAALADADILFTPGDAVALAAIKDPELLSCAQRVLENLGKPAAREIRLADVTDLSRIFINTKFNGDGIVPAGSAETPEVARAIEDILRALPGPFDRNGKPGVDAAMVNRFFDEAQALCAWADRKESNLELEAAGTAVRAVRTKVNDYFARCRLAAYDPHAVAALNCQTTDYRALADMVLNDTNTAIAAFPLAVIAPDQPLPLAGPVNPAWAAALAALSKNAIMPLLGRQLQSLSESDWDRVKSMVAAVMQWQDDKPDTPVEVLGLPRLRELLTGDLRQQLLALVARDAGMRQEYERVAALEKLVRYCRDLHEILTNTVNFADFYGQTQAVFQAGVLFLDARACSLCVEVTNPDRHAALAGLSGAFLVYCDITRPAGLRKTIVAAVTNGDSDNLMAGRNGIFYDRAGRDWNATVTRIVSNPISVREAFWLPYKKLVRMIEEQIAKRAQAADADSTAKLSDTASKLAAPELQAQAAKPPQKIDLGTIALIGTAIGGISALVGGFLQALFGLGLWLPLGLLGVLLLISGPAMLLASMKLRQRNLGPLLDAGGWAINTKARINIPFGASLTTLAVLPKGSDRLVADPFSEKKRGRYLLLIVPVVVLLALFWGLGYLDRALPGWARRTHPAVSASQLDGDRPQSGSGLQPR